MGSELSCDEAYRGHLIENELSSCNRRSEVYERIRNCRIIVGTVAAISGKPELFRLKHFDVAIIDEATQILEPQLLGILCARGEDGKDAIDKFVLIISNCLLLCSKIRSNRLFMMNLYCLSG